MPDRLPRAMSTTRCANVSFGLTRFIMRESWVSGIAGETYLDRHLVDELVARGVGHDG